MTTPPPNGPVRRRAAIIGLSLDGPPRPVRLVAGEHGLLLGGSDEGQQELLETMLRLEAELERLGARLGDLEPHVLAEVAWRIDSPELAAVAERLDEGLRRKGRSFHESTAEELTALAGGWDS